MSTTNTPNTRNGGVTTSAGTSADADAAQGVDLGDRPEGQLVPGGAAPAPRSRIGPAGWLRHSLAITNRNLLHLIRYPTLLTFVILQPVMFVVLFNYVFGGAISLPGVDYAQFLIPGIIIQTVAFGGAATGIGLTEDLSKGTLDRFRSLPIARSAYLTGRIVADSVRTALSVLVIFGVGYLIGFRFEAGFPAALGAILLAIAFGSSMSWVGAWIGMAAKTPEAAQSGGFIWLFPLVFASSIFVQPTSMPGWLEAFAEINPISIMANATRALTNGGAVTTPLLQSLAWIAGITVVFFALSVRQYRKIQ
jgi:ABC transporter DrrB family efflux protein